MKFLGILFNRMVEAAKKNEKTIDVLIANKMKEEKNSRLVEKKNSAIYFELIVFLFFINSMMLLSKFYLFCSFFECRIKWPKIQTERRKIRRKKATFLKHFSFFGNVCILLIVLKIFSSFLTYKNLR